MCIVIICCPVCDIINLEINHNFLIKPFSYITKNSGQKCKSPERKEVLKAFLIILKGFQLSEIVSDPQSGSLITFSFSRKIRISQMTFSPLEYLIKRSSNPKDRLFSSFKHLNKASKRNPGIKITFHGRRKIMKY